MFSSSRGPSPVARIASQGTSPAPVPLLATTPPACSTTPSPAAPSQPAAPVQYAESNASIGDGFNTNASDGSHSQAPSLNPIPDSPAALEAQAWKQLKRPEGFPSQVAGDLERHLARVREWAEDKSTGGGGHGVINQGITTSGAGQRHMRITCDCYGSAKSSVKSSKKTNCKFVVHIKEVQDGSSKVSVVTHVKLEHNHSLQADTSQDTAADRAANVQAKVQELLPTLAEAAWNSPQSYQLILSSLDSLDHQMKRQKLSPSLPNYGAAGSSLSGAASGQAAADCET